MWVGKERERRARVGGPHRPPCWSLPLQPQTCMLPPCPSFGNFTFSLSVRLSEPGFLCPTWCSPDASRLLQMRIFHSLWLYNTPHVSGPVLLIQSSCGCDAGSLCRSPCLELLCIAGIDWLSSFSLFAEPTKKPSSGEWLWVGYLLPLQAG